MKVLNKSGRGERQFKFLPLRDRLRQLNTSDAERLRRPVLVSEAYASRKHESALDTYLRNAIAEWSDRDRTRSFQAFAKSVEDWVISLPLLLRNRKRVFRQWVLAVRERSPSSLAALIVCWEALALDLAAEFTPFIRPSLEVLAGALDLENADETSVFFSTTARLFRCWTKQRRFGQQQAPQVLRSWAAMLLCHRSEYVRLLAAQSAGVLLRRLPIEDIQPLVATLVTQSGTDAATTETQRRMADGLAATFFYGCCGIRGEPHSKAPVLLQKLQHCILHHEAHYDTSDAFPQMLLAALWWRLGRALTPSALAQLQESTLLVSLEHAHPKRLVHVMEALGACLYGCCRNAVSSSSERASLLSGTFAASVSTLQLGRGSEPALVWLLASYGDAIARLGSLAQKRRFLKSLTDDLADVRVAAAVLESLVTQTEVWRSPEAVPLLGEVLGCVYQRLSRTSLSRSAHLSWILRLVTSIRETDQTAGDALLSTLQRCPGIWQVSDLEDNDSSIRYLALQLATMVRLTGMDDDQQDRLRCILQDDTSLAALLALCRQFPADKPLLDRCFEAASQYPVTPGTEAGFDALVRQLLDRDPEGSDLVLWATQTERFRLQRDALFSAAELELCAKLARSSPHPQLESFFQAMAEVYQIASSFTREIDRIDAARLHLRRVLMMLRQQGRANMPQQLVRLELFAILGILQLPLTLYWEEVPALWRAAMEQVDPAALFEQVLLPVFQATQARCSWVSQRSERFAGEERAGALGSHEDAADAASTPESSAAPMLQTTVSGAVCSPEYESASGAAAGAADAASTPESSAACLLPAAEPSGPSSGTQPGEKELLRTAKTARLEAKATRPGTSAPTHTSLAQRRRSDPAKRAALSSAPLWPWLANTKSSSDRIWRRLNLFQPTAEEAAGQWAAPLNAATMTNAASTDSAVATVASSPRTDTCLTRSSVGLGSYPYSVSPAPVLSACLDDEWSSRRLALARQIIPADAFYRNLLQLVVPVQQSTVSKAHQKVLAAVVTAYPVPAGIETLHWRQLGSLLVAQTQSDAPEADRVRYKVLLEQALRSEEAALQRAALEALFQSSTWHQQHRRAYLPPLLVLLQPRADNAPAKAHRTRLVGTRLATLREQVAMLYGALVDLAAVQAPQTKPSDDRQPAAEDGAKQPLLYQLEQRFQQILQSRSSAITLERHQAASADSPGDFTYSRSGSKRAARIREVPPAATVESIVILPNDAPVVMPLVANLLFGRARALARFLGTGSTQGTQKKRYRALFQAIMQCYGFMGRYPQILQDLARLIQQEQREETRLVLAIAVADLIQSGLDTPWSLFASITALAWASFCCWYAPEREANKGKRRLAARLLQRMLCLLANDQVHGRVNGWVPVASAEAAHSTAPSGIGAFVENASTTITSRMEEPGVMVVDDVEASAESASLRAVTGQRVEHSDAFEESSIPGQVDWTQILPPTWFADLLRLLNNALARLSLGEETQSAPSLFAPLQVLLETECYVQKLVRGYPVETAMLWQYLVNCLLQVRQQNLQCLLLRLMDALLQRTARGQWPPVLVQALVRCLFVSSPRAWKADAKLRVAKRRPEPEGPVQQAALQLLLQLAERLGNELAIDESCVIDQCMDVSASASLLPNYAQEQHAAVPAETRKAMHAQSLAGTSSESSPTQGVPMDTAATARVTGRGALAEPAEAGLVIRQGTAVQVPGEAVPGTLQQAALVLLEALLMLMARKRIQEATRWTLLDSFHSVCVRLQHRLLPEQWERLLVLLVQLFERADLFPLASRIRWELARRLVTLCDHIPDPSLRARVGPVASLLERLNRISPTSIGQIDWDSVLGAYAERFDEHHEADWRLLVPHLMAGMQFTDAAIRSAASEALIKLVGSAVSTSRTCSGTESTSVAAPATRIASATPGEAQAPTKSTRQVPCASEASRVVLASGVATSPRALVSPVASRLRKRALTTQSIRQLDTILKTYGQLVRLATPGLDPVWLDGLRPLTEAVDESEDVFQCLVHQQLATRIRACRLLDQVLATGSIPVLVRKAFLVPLVEKLIGLASTSSRVHSEIEQLQTSWLASAQALLAERLLASLPSSWCWQRFALHLHRFERLASSQRSASTREDAHSDARMSANARRLGQAQVLVVYARALAALPSIPQEVSEAQQIEQAPDTQHAPLMVQNEHRTVSPETQKSGNAPEQLLERLDALLVATSLRDTAAVEADCPASDRHLERIVWEIVLRLLQALPRQQQQQRAVWVPRLVTRWIRTLGLRNQQRRDDAREALQLLLRILGPEWLWCIARQLTETVQVSASKKALQHSEGTWRLHVWAYTLHMLLQTTLECDAYPTWHLDLDTLQRVLGLVLLVEFRDPVLEAEKRVSKLYADIREVHVHSAERCLTLLGRVWPMDRLANMVLALELFVRAFRERLAFDTSGSTTTTTTTTTGVPSSAERYRAASIAEREQWRRLLHAFVDGIHRQELHAVAPEDAETAVASQALVLRYLLTKPSPRMRTDPGADTVTTTTTTTAAAAAAAEKTPRMTTGSGTSETIGFRDTMQESAHLSVRNRTSAGRTQVAASKDAQSPSGERHIQKTPLSIDQARSKHQYVRENVPPEHRSRQALQGGRKARLTADHHRDKNATTESSARADALGLGILDAGQLAIVEQVQQLSPELETFRQTRRSEAAILVEVALYWAWHWRLLREQRPSCGATTRRSSSPRVDVTRRQRTASEEAHEAVELDGTAPGNASVSVEASEASLPGRSPEEVAWQRARLVVWRLLVEPLVLETLRARHDELVIRSLQLLERLWRAPHLVQDKSIRVHLKRLAPTLEELLERQIVSSSAEQAGAALPGSNSVWRSHALPASGTASNRDLFTTLLRVMATLVTLPAPLPTIMGVRKRSQQLLTKAAASALTLDSSPSRLSAGMTVFRLALRAAPETNAASTAVDWCTRSTLWPLVERLSQLLIQRSDATLRDQCISLLVRYCWNRRTSETERQRLLDLMVQHLDYTYEDGRVACLLFLQRLVESARTSSNGSSSADDHARLESTASNVALGEYLLAPLAVRLVNEHGSEAYQVLRACVRALFEPLPSSSRGTGVERPVALTPGARSLQQLVARWLEPGHEPGVRLAAALVFTLVPAGSPRELVTLLFEAMEPFIRGNASAERDDSTPATARAMRHKEPAHEALPLSASYSEYEEQGETLANNAAADVHRGISRWCLAYAASRALEQTLQPEHVQCSPWTKADATRLVDALAFGLPQTDRVSLLLHPHPWVRASLTRLMELMWQREQHPQERASAPEWSPAHVSAVAAALCRQLSAFQGRNTEATAVIERLLIAMALVLGQEAGSSWRWLLRRLSGLASRAREQTSTRRVALRVLEQLLRKHTGAASTTESRAAQSTEHQRESREKPGQLAWSRAIEPFLAAWIFPVYRLDRLRANAENAHLDAELEASAERIRSELEQPDRLGAVRFWEVYHRVTARDRQERAARLAERKRLALVDSVEAAQRKRRRHGASRTARTLEKV